MARGLPVVSLPDVLPIVPLKRPPDATIRVPGSKSMTNRALVLAALASRHADCTIRAALESEDTELMVEALGQLGFAVRPAWSQTPPAIYVDHLTTSAASGTPNGNETPLSLRRTDLKSVLPGQPWFSPIPRQQADLFVGNSGTCMRFLTALVSLGQGRYRLDGVPRMRERPIEDLLIALRALGAVAVSELGQRLPAGRRRSKRAKRRPDKSAWEHKQPVRERVAHGRAPGP